MTGLPMDVLGRREARLLRQALLPGEAVLCICVGFLGQALVITDSQVVTIKCGWWATGSLRGSRLSSFDYRNVVAAEVHMGLLDGVLVLHGGGFERHGMWEDQGADLGAPNTIVISRRQAAGFLRAAAFIRARLAGQN